MMDQTIGVTCIPSITGLGLVLEIVTEFPALFQVADNCALEELLLVPAAETQNAPKPKPVAEL